jgi:hypothetical protein
MGNQLSLITSNKKLTHLPSSTNVKDLLIINEYSKSHIANILETHEYWLNSDFSLRPTLTRNAFEDVFGNLVRDSEEHFTHFLLSSSKIQELIPSQNQLQYDSTQQLTINACETLEVLTTIILYSSDSIKIKVSSIFNISYSDNRKKDEPRPAENRLTREEVLIMFQRVLSGTSRLFNIKDIEEKTLKKVIDDILNNYFDLNHTFNKNPNKKTDDNCKDHSDKTLNFNNFWQLCQDSKILWEFLINVNEFCKLEKLRDRFTNVNMTPIKPFLIETESNCNDDNEEYHIEEELSIETLVNQINSPILPQIPIENSFIDLNESDKKILNDNRNRHPLWDYSILDMINDSWLKPSPIIGSEDMIFTSLEHIILSSKSSIPVFLREKTNESNEGNINFNSNKQSSQTIKKDVKIHDFIGVIDSFTILSWLVEACPSQITDSVELTKLKQRGDSSNPDRYRSGPDTALTMFQIGTKFSSSNQRVRENITNNGLKATSNKWQDIGEILALSTVRSALNGKYLQSLPKYHKSQTLLTDNFAYDVILKVAQGYKNIPVSTNVSHPKKPNQLINLLDVVDFIYKFCGEILGKSIINLPVENSGMVKKSHSVKGSTIFGTCIALMVSKNTDCIAIVDEKGKFSGRLNSSLLVDMWFQWYVQTVYDQTSDHECTLDELKHDYQRGLYKMYDGTDQTFSVFSILFSPLKFYDKVKITDFDLMLCGNNVKEPDTSDTDSNSDDSESSDSDEKESIADTDTTSTTDDDSKSKNISTLVKSNINGTNNTTKSNLNNPNILTTKKGIILPERVNIKANNNKLKNNFKSENKRMSIIAKDKLKQLKPEVNFELIISKFIITLYNFYLY